MAYQLIIPILTALAGTAISARAASKAADRADAEAQRLSTRQNKLLDKQRASVLENLRTYDPTKRKEAQDQQATETEKMLNTALTEAAETAAPTEAAATGRVSQDYLTKRATSVRDATNRASALAGLLARFRAPSKLRTEESLDNADFTSREADIGALLRDRARTGEQLVAKAGRVDPWEMAIGQGLQSYGMSAAGGQIMQGLGTGAGAAGGGSYNGWV